MARIFERNLENPERRIEKEGDFSQIIDSNEEPYEDKFDEMLDSVEGRKKEQSKREQFINDIKVEQPSEETPLTLAYKELDNARKCMSKEDIIKAEDKILDLERQEQKKEYKVRMIELKQMQQMARTSNKPELMNEFKKKRQAFVKEMDYDRLTYEIAKLQNSQRLSPSKDTLQQIIELKEELALLEQEMSR